MTGHEWGETERAFLAQVQDVHAPSHLDRARLRAKLRSTLAAGATVGVATTVGVTKAATATVAVKVIGTGVVIACAFAAATWLRAKPTEPQTSRPAVAFAPPPEVIPPPAVTPPPLAPPVAARVAVVAQPPRPRLRDKAFTKVTAPVVEVASNSGTLALERETALVEQALRALERGEHQAALATIAQYSREFPHGVLTEEALALEIRALCASGKREQGLRLRERFLLSSPHSPLLARVKAACDTR